MKKMFKVLTHVDTKTGGFWMRVGSAFVNRDESINILLDAIPKSFELQLRELDEEDLRKRESFASRATPQPAASPLRAASEQIPF